MERRRQKPDRTDEFIHASKDAGASKEQPPSPILGGVSAHTSPLALAASPAALQRLDTALVQFRRSVAGAFAPPAPDVHAVAARGVEGLGSPLPHVDAIQASFGRHDVAGVQSFSGGSAREATAALGATAYATGGRVAFADPAPSLHTAAHEAAHVVQQRAGVQLEGGVGAAGDPYERHADAVADLVVQGKSAEALLDRYAGGAGATGGVQRKAVQLEQDEAPDYDALFPRTPDGTGKVGERDGKTYLYDFAQGSAALLKPHTAELDAIYDAFGKAWPLWLCVHEVSGYASTEGGDEANFNLSYSRAQAVFSYLLQKENVDESDLDDLRAHVQLVTTGLGETDELGSERRYNRAVILDVRDEPYGGATELEPGVVDRGDAYYGGVDKSDPTAVPDGHGPPEAKAPYESVTFWFGRAAQVGGPLALNVVSAASVAGALVMGGIAVVGGFVLSVVSGLSALGKAHDSGENRAGVMGAAYGFVAAGDLLAGPPGPPSDVEGTAANAWKRWAGTTFASSRVELNRIAAKLQEAEDRGQTDPKLVLTEQELKFLGFLKALHEAPEPGLNSVHQGLVRECLSGQSQANQEGRYLTWPTPKPHRNLGTGRQEYERRTGEDYPEDEYPLEA